MASRAGTAMWYNLSLLLVVACLHFRSAVCHTVWDATSPNHDHSHFSYDPDPTSAYGVLNWGKSFTGQCAGSHQSPVDIQTNSVRHQPKLACPVFTYTNNQVRGTFKNNGHAPEFIPLRENDLVVSNVPYRLGEYRFQGFHIHYGGDVHGKIDRNTGVRAGHGGSEHALDGVRFDGELHMVLCNRKYKDVTDAETRTDGLVVLVFFIETAPSSTDPRATELSQFLETNNPVITNKGANVSAAINLGLFLDQKCEFYTYAGSLTTPMCHESVRWVISREPLIVTETAWQTLAGLQGHGAHGNCRGIQPLNDRVIEANFATQRNPTTLAPVRKRGRGQRGWMRPVRPDKAFPIGRQSLTDPGFPMDNPSFTEPGYTMDRYPWSRADPAMNSHRRPSPVFYEGYETGEGGPGFRRGRQRRQHRPTNQAAADVEYEEHSPRNQRLHMLHDL